ncbi:hypothetical protein [Actinophytocola gossypii]|uniref:Uncharacterized protein n=1 Tax=Actinophytocola gossypii TaxID=2812003 RepID=A0ABT2J8E0_9PSEU|nr:hypothetical protein [Actinophytocola gossypii]MCT2584121.1 hypothetical protein [Actinophytocola gossypii]
MGYRWSCDDSPSFGDQGDAEDWLRDNWADLLARGVDDVTLVRDGDRDGGDGEVVYGPMSLHPPD